MVEQDAVAGIHAVGFTIIDHDPISIQFGTGIRGAGIKGCALPLGDFLHQTEQFGSRGLIHAAFLFQPVQTDSLEQTQRSEGIHFSSVFRHIKRNLHMALRRQIVDFIRSDLRHQTTQIHGIGHITVMQKQAGGICMCAPIQGINAFRIEG